MELLEGTGVALVTPFKNDFSIDYDALKRLLVHTEAVDYWVVNGTTAESPTLDQNEKTAVLRFIKENNTKQIPIIFGIGGNNTAQLLETIKSTDFKGIEAILSSSPNYNKPSQEGLLRHYTQLADNCPVPLVLYNVPSRTASNIEAATTVALSQHSNIVGIKEASCDLEQSMQILEESAEGFKLVSGDDLSTLPLLSLGAAGVISVMANALPNQFSRMVRLAKNNNWQEARKILRALRKTNQMLFWEGNPSGVKALLELQNVCERTVRLPLVAASEELFEKLGQETKKKGLI